MTAPRGPSALSGWMGVEPLRLLPGTSAPFFEEKTRRYKKRIGADVRFFLVPSCLPSKKFQGLPAHWKTLSMPRWRTTTGSALNEKNLFRITGTQYLIRSTNRYCVPAKNARACSSGCQAVGLASAPVPGASAPIFRKGRHEGTRYGRGASAWFFCLYLRVSRQKIMACRPAKKCARRDDADPGATRYRLLKFEDDGPGWVQRAGKFL